MAYDPAKAHAYYERTKRLKGRKAASTPGTKPSSSPVARASPTLRPETHAAIAKVGRLKAAVIKLQGALSKAEAALSEKRQAARATEKQNSDGKSTSKEKKASEDYRNKHKTELASKKKSASSGGGTSSTSSQSLSDMSVDELTSRVIKIRSVLSDAKKQLSSAQQQLGQLAHSDIISEPMSNEQFARFRSAERMPST